MQIERATHGNLASQMKTLTDENALLKEDLAFFQTLMTSSGDAGRGYQHQPLPRACRCAAG